MSDLNNDESTEIPMDDELTILKKRADLMGVRYHPSIGVDKLREKVIAAQEGTEPPEDDEDGDEEEQEEAVVPSTIPTPSAMLASQAPAAAATTTDTFFPKAPVQVENETMEQKQRRQRLEALEQVRIRVTCMNPAKKEWDCVHITVGNSLIGTVGKMIPLENDAGWHVPRIIYNALKEMTYNTFHVRKDPETGFEHKYTKTVREYAIEVMDPLTPAELEALKQRQLMASGTTE